MAWPMSQDYNEAVQGPEVNFGDPELRQSKAVTNPLGIPIPCSGNFADVYEMRGPNGRRWAVKCFTRQVPGLGQRYEAISRHLQKTQLPFVVSFKYLEQGIRVSGQWYPVLKMQWVEGLMLNEFVRRYADRAENLAALLRLWARLAEKLRAAGIAHGDLQHGNLLLVPSAANSLGAKLIDYDGMYVPALAGCPSGELGHPCYQHPQRRQAATYGPDLDRFSLLLIATALVSLQTGGRRLWEKYDSGDNLLFREADLQAPMQSVLFAELLKLPSPTARKLVSLLLDALSGRLASIPVLDEVLSEQEQAAAGPRMPSPAPREDRSWWDEVEASATAGEEAATASSPRLRRGAARRNPNKSRAAVWALGGIAVGAVLGAIALGPLVWRSSPTEPTRVAAATIRPSQPGPPRTTPGTPATKPGPATTPKPPPPTSAPLPPKTVLPPPPTVKPPATKPEAPLTLQSSIPDLRQALKEENLARQEKAAELLAKLGAAAAEAVPDLARTLKGSRGMQARCNAAIALACIGAAARPGVPALAAALRSEVPVEVRRSAAEALSRLGYPIIEEALPVLAATLKGDKDVLVRQRCVWAFFRCPDLNRHDVRNILSALVDERGPETTLVRYDAARLLASQLKQDVSARTADVLLEMLQNKTLKVFVGSEVSLGGDARYMAADALAWTGKKAGSRKDIVDALKRAATDPDPQLSKSASAALKSLGAP